MVMVWSVVRHLQLGASGCRRNCCDPALHPWPVLGLSQDQGQKNSSWLMSVMRGLPRRPRYPILLFGSFVQKEGVFLERIV